MLCRVDIVDDLYRGAVQVAQSYGVGTFEANTVMLGWLREQERAKGYAQMLRELPLLGKSMVLVRHRPERGLGTRSVIHIWWGGLARNGGLMLLLAVLLRSHPDWRHAAVNVLTVVDDEAARAEAESGLRRLLEGVLRTPLASSGGYADSSVPGVHGIERVPSRV